MIPILFEGTEINFTSNGIGRLSDAISCKITEERNGAYELEMVYPIDGIHFSDITLGRYIYAKPNKYANKQAFEVYQITKPLNGKCTVYAYHISYRLSKIPAMPFTAGSCADALAGLKTNAAESCPFTFTTTKTTVATYKQTVPRDIRSCLGGVQGSVLDVFGGGDYEFDMFSVKLWQNRGADRGFQVRYGKNLVDLRQEESIENTITGIVPYYTNESTTVTLPEKVIETAEAASFPYHRTIPVDLSSHFENSVPTANQLRAAGNAYIASHEIGVPKVSLTVSFVNLADTAMYKDIAVLEDVRMCDIVTVYFEKLGVNAQAKVIGMEFDVLKERYISIELGESRTSLAAKIAGTEKAVEESPSVIQDAVNRATNLITGESGGYVVIHTNDDGKPYEILIMDTEDINTAVHVWRWNNAGWGYSSNGYNGTYTLAATIDGGIVADFIKAGTITGIAFNNGNGTFKVDAAGNMTATNATITGTISGSAISGGTISGTIISGSAISGGSFTSEDAAGITKISISGGAFDATNATYGYRAILAPNAVQVGTGSGGSFSVAAWIGLAGGYVSNTFGVGSTLTAANLTVTGSKSRLAKTEDYGDRLLYCYETPSPLFGDLGEGKTDDTGVCEIWLDDIFSETVDTEVMYQVFLQKYGDGDLWIEERTASHFTVKGTPNMRFGWEIKATQKEYDTMRLEEYTAPDIDQDNAEVNAMDESLAYLNTLLYKAEEVEVA